jgi:UDP-N-acetylmuramoylalanine--D-glutamate ligase
MNAELNKLVILGAAESGIGAAILGKRKGYEVFVSDRGNIAEAYRLQLEQENIEFEQGQHSIERLLTADLVVKSPGIPEKASVIQTLRDADITIISEIEFASCYTTAKIIAITGSNGKTTTTLLTHHLLKNAGFSVALAGNIGDSFALHVATQAQPDWYVLEISSFQLDDVETFKPHIAIITNITPDHLDRYNYDFEEYICAKFNITINQDENDFLIYGADNNHAFIIDLLDDVAANNRLGMCPYTLAEDTKTLMQIIKAASPDPDDAPTNIPLLAFPKQGNLCFKQGTEHDFFELEQAINIPISTLPLKGKHNQLNAMAATMAALLAGASAHDISQALGSFTAPPHRLEPCGTINGIDFINDSKATNVDSAWYALDAMTQPIVWIAGGTDKGNDYSALNDLVAQKVKALICMTTDSSKLRKAYSHLIPHIVEAHSTDNAVQQALAIAQSGDVVLLSPCCASFDLFKNYEDRGNQFKDSVAKYL